MANWIHRTTYQFLRSRDPDLADQVNWLNLGSQHPATITGSDDPSDWEVVGNLVQLKAEGTRLVTKKLAKVAAINNKTAGLISQGFSYGGETFSLSLQAQANLQDLYARRASLSWPMVVENINDTATVTLNDQTEGGAFYTAAYNTIVGHRATGKALKDQVRSASTIVELDAIVDNR